MKAFVAGGSATVGKPLVRIAAARDVSQRDVKRARGWPRTGPPRRPPQRLSRDKRFWREEPVGLFAVRTRQAL